LHRVRPSNPDYLDKIARYWARLRLGRRQAFAAADAKGNSLSYKEAMAEARAWLESKV
jgi:hypothetical protein